MKGSGSSLHPLSRVITRGFAKNLRNQQCNHSLNLSIDVKCEKTEYFEPIREYVHKKFDKLRQHNGDRPETAKDLDSVIQHPTSEGYWPLNKKHRKNSDESSVSNDYGFAENLLESFIKTEKIEAENDVLDNYNEYEEYQESSLNPSLKTSQPPINIKTNPTLAPIILNLPAQKLSQICRYNPNMARKFPPKNRTPKELERRIKNTEACRISRRKKKLEDFARDQMIEEKKRKHIENLRKILYNLIYIQMGSKSVLEIMHQFDKAPVPMSE